MEEKNTVKDFVAKYKTPIAVTATAYIFYRIGYKKAFNECADIMNTFFKAMKESGYNVYQIVESGVKNV